MNADSALDLYYLARLAHLDGLNSRALQLLEESVAIAEHFKSRELMAVCYIAIGRREAAIESLELAYALGAKSSKTACLLAELLIENDQLNRGREILKAVLENHHDYGPAKRLLQGIGA